MWKFVKNVEALSTDSVDFYWLSINAFYKLSTDSLLTLHWLSTDSYWLSTDFYWLSNDYLLTSTESLLISTDSLMDCFRSAVCLNYRELLGTFKCYMLYGLAGSQTTSTARAPWFTSIYFDLPWITSIYPNLPQ